jgi:hypothetical protein
MPNRFRVLPVSIAGFSQKESGGCPFLNVHYTKIHQKGFVGAPYNYGFKENE